MTRTHALPICQTAPCGIFPVEQQNIFTSYAVPLARPFYDGRRLPVYCYKPATMVIGIKSGPEGTATGYLYLPCPDRQLKRSLERAGTGNQGFQMEVITDDLPPQVSALASPTRDNINDINQLCRVIEPLSTAEGEKLEAVVRMAQPASASEIRQLAENLNQFDFVPGVGLAENSQVNELGYVAYHGSLPLEALMGPPHEPSQRRVVWGEEPQRNERALPEGQDERYGACGDEMREDPAEQHQQETGGISPW